MKRCTQCGDEKPEDAFEMQPSRGRLRAECRECRRIASREWYAKRRLNPPEKKPETKRCKDCLEVKSISEFRPNGAGYFHARCKTCEKAIHQAKRREQYRNDPTGRFYWPFVNEAGIRVKPCTYCHAEKATSEFYTNRPGRLHGKCKDCDKAIRQANYDANPEKYRSASLESARRHPDRARARHQRWYNANREYYVRYHREYYAANRDRYLAYYRVRHSKETPGFRHMWYVRRREYFQVYVETNKERIRENGHKWRQRHPEKHADIYNRYRARKRNAPRIEKIDRKAIIERDNWTCYLCGVTCTPQNVTLDHVVPLYRDGTHTADNLRVACRPCNSRKGTKLLCELLLSA